jgi:hypothetical protein
VVGVRQRGTGHVLRLGVGAGRERPLGSGASRLWVRPAAGPGRPLGATGECLPIAGQINEVAPDEHEQAVRGVHIGHGVGSAGSPQPPLDGFGVEVEPVGRPARQLRQRGSAHPHLGVEQLEQLSTPDPPGGLSLEVSHFDACHRFAPGGG